ncbi:hypothetical protein [Mucilaginibacter ginsenosidivorans]|uniref:Uncharacterized protein n=1 Tax=Mucilaginibacter ginsenosidivorans TaxID=398053 RepID=A0A5B8UWM4_9SPHI|nr:hypothetical protein [Mucilaginibacter ginsenosidivorans]QEC63329.1 hypothetical protein FRZ54_12340 [Mucilaginibacter ginsenosidivorans]
MSLKSFLSKIWAEAKRLFEGIPPELKTAIKIGVVVTENIKKFTDSPAADVLTAIIPGDIDDKIKDLLRAKLPAILAELKLADSCAGLTDPAAITSCAVKVLQGIGGDTQSAFLHNLAILVAEVAADGKLSWSDGVYLLEWYYKHEYKPAA